jgi:hypothetical protein
MGRLLLAGFVVVFAGGVTLGQTPPSPAPGPAPGPAGGPAVSALPELIPQPGRCDCAPERCCPLESCGCPACGPDGRFWVGADYLLWRVRGDSLPPLLTTSPPGTPRAEAGLLSTPGTVTLFGDSKVNDDWRSGGRVWAGFWLDCEQRWGVEANYFMLEDATTHFDAASDSNPILVRPFINALTNRPDGELIGFPGVATGHFSASETSALLGAGVWLRRNVCCGECYRLDALLGYRYLRLSDRLGISEDLTSTDPTSATVPVGTRVAVADQFDTTNDFHGVDLGLTGEIRRGRWVLEGVAKVALGTTGSELNVNGFTTVAVPGFAPVTQSGGLLALSSNSGHFSANRFGVVPEVGVKVGYQVTPHLRATVGYDFLFWNDVVRAGSQIDPVVNPNLLPPATPGGPSRPAPRIGDTTDLWVHGVSFGLEFRF